MFSDFSGRGYMIDITLNDLYDSLMKPSGPEDFFRMTLIISSMSVTVISLFWLFHFGWILVVCGFQGIGPFQVFKFFFFLRFYVLIHERHTQREAET